MPPVGLRTILRDLAWLATWLWCTCLHCQALSKPWGASCVVHFLGPRGDQECHWPQDQELKLGAQAVCVLLSINHCSQGRLLTFYFFEAACPGRSIVVIEGRRASCHDEVATGQR